MKNKYIVMIIYELLNKKMSILHKSLIDILKKNKNI